MAEENSIVARLFKKGLALESKMRAWAVCFNLDFSWSQAGLQVWVTLWGTCWRLHWANFLFCSLSQDNPCSLVPVDNWEVRFGLGKSTVRGKVGWEETTQISEGLERFQSSRKKWKKKCSRRGQVLQPRFHTDSPTASPGSSLSASISLSSRMQIWKCLAAHMCTYTKIHTFIHIK